MTVLPLNRSQKFESNLDFFWKLVPQPWTHDFRVQTPPIGYSFNLYGEFAVILSALGNKSGPLELWCPSHSQCCVLIQRKLTIIPKSSLQFPSSLFVSILFVWSLFTSFWFTLVLDDERYINSLLLMDLIPSTTTHYLGWRLEIFLVPWNLQSSMESILIVDSSDTSIPFDQ